MEVKTQDISKIYRISGKDVKVLDEVNVSIPSGAFVIISGVSGVGKTTLLSIISGIELATSGKVLFDGWDFMAMNERERSDFRLRQIGFIFQNFNLIPSLTARENVSLPLINLKDKKEILKRADSVLEMVGIGHRADNFPDTLSFGEKQRVVVAMAIVNKPGLILADEPVSNLEDESAERIMQILYEFNQKARVTIILCTNSGGIAKQKCDRLYRLESGRVKAANEFLS